MNIAFIAHDSRKKLMQNLCIAYRSILMHHDLYATGSTGHLISDATGLKIHNLLSGYIGGEEQLVSIIEQNQIDVVIFFRDPDNVGIRGEQDVNMIIRICDNYNIPLATNIASAEMLLKSLEQGDLEWREMYR